MQPKLFPRLIHMIRMTIITPVFCFAQVTEAWVAKHDGTGNLRDITITASGPVVPKGVAQEHPKYINLAANQTGIRQQGSRRTCITFATIAAMEAAYKKAGYGDLDLSEQFLNHIGKTFWLHHDWNAILDLGNDGAESQVGAFTGGNSIEYMELLAKGLKLPSQEVMDYRDTDYNERDYPPLANAWNGPFWKKQKNINDFNLDKRFLPQAALTADKYYSIRSFRRVDATNATSIERALAAGKEVSWDFEGPRATFPIWDTCNRKPADCGLMSHAMLIIGYDRRDTDPKKHFFLVKNSWGRSRHPDGYERLSYEYVRRYGTSAGYIESINPPMPWTELSFVGRWELNFDGHKGVLDIYHIPRIHEPVLLGKDIRTKDYRIGTFYDAGGRAFKVNGTITGATIRFYIDGNNPNARWDALRGREFSYTLLDSKSMIMAGLHKDPDGRIYGGMARKDGVHQQTSPLSGPINTSSYTGNWNVWFKNIAGKLTIQKNDPVLTAGNSNGKDHDAFVGTLRIGKTGYDVRFFVEKGNPSHVSMQIPGILGSPGTIRAYLLNFDKGTVAGTALFSNSQEYGFLMMSIPETKVTIPVR